MPTLPCPQAAASIGQRVQNLDPWTMAIERPLAGPRQLPPWDGPEVPPAPDPGIRWPYHAPRWNGLDLLWWSVLARAAYSPDNTFMRRTASWASPIARMVYSPPVAPPSVGVSLIELADQWLMVVPGTTTELEMLQYVISHVLQLVTRDPVEGWETNSAWYGRGTVARNAAAGWPPPAAKPLFAIGHSSGGATAAIAALLDIHAASTRPVTIVTFGSPQWSTPLLSTFSSLLKQPQVIEFTTPADPVPNLPPAWSVLDTFPPARLLVPRPNYRHYGALLEVDGSGTVFILDPPAGDEAERDLASLLRGDLNTAAHSMATYSINALANANAQEFPPYVVGLIGDLGVIIRDLTLAHL